MPLLAALDEALGPGFQILGLAGAAVAFLCGLYQYAQTQKWKRLEFVAQEMKAFESDPAVQVAFQMLDWSARALPLLKGQPRGAPGAEETDSEMNAAEWDASAAATGPAQPPGTGRWVRVTGHDVISALEHHTVRQQKPNPRFTSVEVRIRDCFDRFFDHWSRFGHYIQTGLVECGDCQPYLAYWLRVIYDEKSHRDDDFRKAIQGYVTGYYSGTGVDVLVREYRARSGGRSS